MEGAALSSHGHAVSTSVFQANGMLQNIMNLRDSVFVNTLGFFCVATWIILSGAFSYEKIRCFLNENYAGS